LNPYRPVTDDRRAFDFTRFRKNLKLAFEAWGKDNAPQYAAAIAFYTILSLGPLLVLAITLAGFLFEQEAAKGEIVQNVQQYIGSEAAAMVQDIVRNASERGGGGALAGIVGFLVLAFAASRIFKQLKIALNQIFDVPPPEEGGLGRIVRTQLLAIAGVVGFGIFLILSVSASALVATVARHVMLPGGSFIWQVVSAVVTLGLIAVVFALIFRYLPDVNLGWRHVWEGAIFTAVLFLLGQMAISIYLSNAEPGARFGPAGPLIVVIVWVYYTTAIFFFGAEFTEVRCRNDRAVEADRSRRHAQAGTAATGKALVASGGKSTTGGPGAVDASPPIGAEDAAASRAEQPRKKKGSKALPAAAGGCIGFVTGTLFAMLGLFVASARIVSKMFRRS
jgi:membrane protein